MTPNAPTLLATPSLRTPLVLLVASGVALGGLFVARRFSIPPEPATLVSLGVDADVEREKIRRAARAEARRDIAAGHPRVLTYGLGEMWESAYATLMRERYGVEVVSLGGCMVEMDAVVRANAYNEVSRPWIQSRWGASVFERTWDEAELIGMRWLYPTPDFEDLVDVDGDDEPSSSQAP